MTASPLPRAGWITLWILQINPQYGADYEPAIPVNGYAGTVGTIGDWTAHDCFECEILERERVRPE